MTLGAWWQRDSAVWFLPLVVSASSPHFILKFILVYPGTVKCKPHVQPSGRCSLQSGAHKFWGCPSEMPSARWQKMKTACWVPAIRHLNFGTKACTTLPPSALSSVWLWWQQSVRLWFWQRVNTSRAVGSGGEGELRVDGNCRTLESPVTGGFSRQGCKPWPGLAGRCIATVLVDGLSLQWERESEATEPALAADQQSHPAGRVCSPAALWAGNACCFTCNLLQNKR